MWNTKGDILLVIQFKKEIKIESHPSLGDFKNDFKRMIDLRGEEMIEKSTINTLTF